MEYYAFTTQGLESITAREVEYALPDAVVTRARGGIVRFTYSGEQAPLLRLGTTEDVYAYIADGTVSRERKGKHDVARRLAASPHWHEAVGAALPRNELVLPRGSVCGGATGGLERKGKAHLVASSGGDPQENQLLVEVLAPLCFEVDEVPGEAEQLGVFCHLAAKLLQATVVAVFDGTPDAAAEVLAQREASPVDQLIAELGDRGGVSVVVRQLSAYGLEAGEIGGCEGGAGGLEAVEAGAMLLLVDAALRAVGSVGRALAFARRTAVRRQGVAAVRTEPGVVGKGAAAADAGRHLPALSAGLQER